VHQDERKGGIEKRRTAQSTNSNEIKKKQKQDLRAGSWAHIRANPVAMKEETGGHSPSIHGVSTGGNTEKDPVIGSDGGRKLGKAGLEPGKDEARAGRPRERRDPPNPSKGTSVGFRSVFRKESGS